MNMVVNQSREQIIGDPDGMQVTVEMQVDIFHGNDLGIATPGSATFHTKYRAQ